VDAIFGQLVQVPAVERGARVARDVERAHGLAARRIERVEAVSPGEPHTRAVEGHAVHTGGALEGTILTEDLGGCLAHGQNLARQRWARE
jgi:hypothetical protein